ncbi:MAG: carbamoyltransferase HypF [Planctomycetia bacterium]|nr:carbamoyltransferase HypF [Planctomycetia bacterium]
MQSASGLNRWCRLRIRGVVQGVGFRPFLWRRANRLGLTGWCENDPDGVTVELAGPAAAVAAFQNGLTEAAPPLAQIEQVETVTEGPAELLLAGSERFVIHASRQGLPGDALVPADVGSCDACLADVADPAGRRYRHPFTNCTDCGPRYTIIESLPYDREATTMRAFAMCPACAAEYADPADRRFHAQPNACPACGPQVWLVEGGVGGPQLSAAKLAGDAAISAARQLLVGGGILAVKGIGGFHLLCDATGSAVAELRSRKQRAGKPLAVLVESVAVAGQFAIVSEQERRLLESRERPIVLLQKRPGASLLAADVAPGNDFVGVMLPCLPLQQLLAVGLPPLVLTSGNITEEPITWQNEEAVEKLGSLVDCLLLHDRKLVLPCDDSVVRCVAGAVLPIRRSRGFAPLPVRLPKAGPVVLAVGGELKATLCLTRADQAFLSPHLGDVGSVETLRLLEQTAEHFQQLLAVRPEAVVADLHPGYLSSDWAAGYAERLGVPLLRVQHHEAHAAALLAEHGLTVTEQPGVAIACFDGTGYGHDGSIWGGEVFVTGQDGLARVATLAPFPLPGGDACIHKPWRTALALLDQAGVNWDERLACVAAAGKTGQQVLKRQLEANLNCVRTSSMGRLFDAVAAILGLKQEVTYEAEAALRLEAVAASVSQRRDATRYRFTLDQSHGLPWSIGWQQLLAAVVADTLAGRPEADVAADFHQAVAGLLLDVTAQLRAAGLTTGRLGLSGGVFQNALLVELAVARLQPNGHEPLLHHQVPANDGGLALGQAVLGRRQVEAG